MKKRQRWFGQILFLIALLGGGTFHGVTEEVGNPMDCRELAIRGGVPNFAKKLQSVSELKVAYLGGSITLAEGWRVKTTRWLRDTFPDKQIVEINSAISGTGSGFGACRLYEHVLKYKPDLIFVEYRVNGGDNSMLRTMEGIVRQTWMLLPKADIIFVYTISSGMVDDIRAGRLPGRNGEELDAVARHYNIPAIDFGPEIVNQLDHGRLVFKGASAPPGVVVFTKDGIHPGDEGHAIYAEVMKRSLTEIFGASAVSAPHTLPVPLDSACWDQGIMYDIESYLVNRQDWDISAGTESQVVRSFQSLWRGIECGRIMPVLGTAKAAGSAIEFSFDGTVFGFFDIGGPETGAVLIKVDDQSSYDVSRFNSFCYRYRPQYYLSKELPRGRHKIRIELAALTLDKESIAGSEKYSADPRFKENTFYPVKILLNGKIVE